jgi:large subunit ribosomal protein L22
VSSRHRGRIRIVGKAFTASHQHARISPFKARPVIDLVRGKPVDEALSILEFQPRRAAPMIRRVIASAKANASNDLEVKINRLVVTEARIDGGPLLGGRPRFMARAMGRAFPIRKRTCHIVVTVAEAEVAPKTRRNGKPAGPSGEARRGKKQRGSGDAVPAARSGQQGRE